MAKCKPAIILFLHTEGPSKAFATKNHQEECAHLPSAQGSSCVRSLCTEYWANCGISFGNSRSQRLWPAARWRNYTVWMTYDLAINSTRPCNWSLLYKMNGYNQNFIACLAYSLLLISDFWTASNVADPGLCIPLSILYTQLSTSATTDVI